MLSPKQLLAGDPDNAKVTFTKDASNNYDTVECIGKQGWVYREIDTVFRTSDTAAKIWVSVEDFRLLFSDNEYQHQSKTAVSSYCLGYLELLPSTSVKTKLGGPAPKTINGVSKKVFSFTVQDDQIQLTLGCDSEKERDEWVTVLKQAITDGIRHVLKPSSALVLPAYALTSGAKDQQGSASAAIEFPHRAGYLKKDSQGKSTFGMKRVKKRWFRLEGGELRYYEDEKVHPSKLKGTLDLQGAEVLEKAAENSQSPPTASRRTSVTNCDSDSNFFVLRLTTEERTMTLEAPSRKVAHEWKQDLIETIELLRFARANKAEFKNRRRVNVYDRIDADQQQELIQKQKNATKAAFSPSSGSSKGFSLFRFGSSSDITRNTSRSRGESKDDQVQFQKANKSIETVAMFKSCLSEHFLLRSLPDLTLLIDALQLHEAVPGEVVVWQGSTGEGFYIIESGLCDVVKDGRVVGLIQPGKSFGELALLNNATRQATVRAVEPSRLWYLTRSQFRFIASLQERAQTDEKLRFLRNVELFEKLTQGNLEKIADVMVMRKYQPDERIIKQGDQGDVFFMIQTGRVVVSQSQGFGAKQVELVRLGPGKYFGELALIEDAPRKASVTASTAVTCWTLDRANFLSLFGSIDEAVNESVGIQMLQKVKLLESLSERQLQTISKCLVSEDFGENEVIIRQGDVGDSFFMIAEGEVSVQVNHVQVAKLESGSYFGEMSLLSNERRSATVTALTQCKCLVLSRQDFTELLGPLDAIIQKESERRKNESALSGKGVLTRMFSSSAVSTPVSSPSLSRKSSAPLVKEDVSNSPEKKGRKRADSLLFANTNSLFELESITRVRKLGSGTFSTVYLVQHNNNKLYAMKMLHKHHLYEMKQEKNVFQERDLMMELLDCQYVAVLYATLQDDNSLYFVMQYVPGGDLWSLLYSSALSHTKQGGLNTSQAQFYLGNVVNILQHIHDLDIVFRDLKPENFVLDANGYLKLVDFGSAKVLSVDEKTNTMCGAPEYIAPEMIFSLSHNKAVDFWQLGVLAFELLTRKSPFAHPNLGMTYCSIVESDQLVQVLTSGSNSTSVSNSGSAMVAAASLDSNARSIIAGFLAFHPNMRLGMGHGGFDDIWNHPFLQGISKKHIIKRKISPPFIPSADLSKSVVDDLDLLDLLDDPDEIPIYAADFDFADF